MFCLFSKVYWTLKYFLIKLSSLSAAYFISKCEYELLKYYSLVWPNYVSRPWCEENLKTLNLRLLPMSIAVSAHIKLFDKGSLFIIFYNNLKNFF